MMKKIIILIILIHKTLILVIIGKFKSKYKKMSKL